MLPEYAKLETKRVIEYFAEPYPAAAAGRTPVLHPENEPMKAQEAATGLVRSEGRVMRRGARPLFSVVLLSASAAFACAETTPTIPSQAAPDPEGFAAGQTSGAQTVEARFTLTPTLAAVVPLPLSSQAPAPPAAATAGLLAPTVQAPAGEAARVFRVIDGDTIVVELNGARVPVRYIGINTPEADEPCGDDATRANDALVGGQTVTLVKDVSETDIYARLLRYVYLGNVFVNAELVARGYAQAVAYPPDTLHYAEFQLLEADAKQAGRGCHPAGIFAVPANGASATTLVAPGQICDPAYPDVCIPPPPPDLDCGDIGVGNFTVLPPDPHGFDGNQDGIGCEG